MIDKILKHLKDKKGAVSIYTIILLAFLLPFLMFTVVDVNHYMQQNRRLKNIVDNAGASAVTMINESQLAYGNIEIDTNEASLVVERIVKESLFLNDDLTPKDISVLAEKPEIQVDVVNTPPVGGVDVDTPISTIKVTNPSVVVYGKFKVKGLFFSRMSVDIQKVGMSQAQFK